MTRKYVQIEFANPRLRAIGKFDDIYQATRAAHSNLKQRHNVLLRDAILFRDKVVLSIDIPDEIVDGFSFGNHLRGISTWLLSNRSDYKKYVVGKRFMNYIEIPKPNDDSSDATNPIDIESKKLEELTEIRKELQNIRVILQSQYVPEYRIEKSAKRNRDGSRIPAIQVALEDPLGELRKRYNISQ